MLVSRLPQNISNVNNECAGKSKQLYSVCDQPLSMLIYLYFIVLILIGSLLIMPGVSCAVYGCYFLRTTAGVSLCTSKTKGTKILELLNIIR